MVNLICCTQNIIVYGKDTDYGDVEIKFLEYTDKTDRNIGLYMMHYIDFKDGYRNITEIDKGIYGDFIYCRIGGNLYKINTFDKSYEIVDTDFCAVCFLKDYVLLIKDDEGKNILRITPEKTEAVTLN